MQERTLGHKLNAGVSYLNMSWGNVIIGAYSGAMAAIQQIYAKRNHQLCQMIAGVSHAS